MLERIDEVIDRAENDLDPTGDRALPKVNGNIDFRHVHFAYREDVPVLKDVSFSIGAGQRVAFVGPTGSGKSTVLSLLLRLYDPDQGDVYVDGVNMREVESTSWREQVALVSQEPFLFHTSLRDNLLYGQTSDEAAMIDAAKKAAIHDFIVQQNEGYDAVVGERGVQLSGGQRQRVVLARALLRDPKVLLLDEATSALDNENEAVVQLALGQWSRGRTTIVVAHRLSTVVDCDVIFVLERGVIVEQGTHAHLLAQGGLYARLALAQGKEVEPSGA